MASANKKAPPTAWAAEGACIKAYGNRLAYADESSMD